MRVLIVGFITFLFTGIVLWACGGFISTIWNPMQWDTPGRLFFVLMVLGVALPCGVAGGCCYEEEMRKLRR